MKKVNLGYDIVVTYKTVFQTDIVNKKEAIQYVKGFFDDEYGIELHDNEIELIKNIVEENDETS